MRPSPSQLIVVFAVVTVAALAAGLAGAVSAPAVHGATSDAAPTANATSNTTNGHVPPSVAQPPNTSSYLTVPDGRLATAEYGTVGVDAPGAMAIDRDRLAVRLSVDAFEQRFGRTSSSPNRTAAVSAALDRLDATVQGARDRQSTALARYNAGTIDTSTFVRTLARSDAVAAAVEDGLARVRTVSDDPLDYSPGRRIEARMDNAQPELATLDGRIRELFVDAIFGGQRAGSTVYLETGSSDVVLATIFEATYIRESYVGDAYDASFEANISAANNRIQELYNWGFLVHNYVSVPSIQRVGNTSVFQAEVTHQQGGYTLYYDNSTRNVFREHQAKRLADAQPRQTFASTNGTLRLVVNATHDTGPMSVQLADNTTGAPLNGTVFVGEDRLGTTGDDGRLWVVDRDSTAEVRVVTAEGSVSTFLYGTD